MIPSRLPRPWAGLLVTCIVAATAVLAQEFVSSQSPRRETRRIVIVNGHEAVDGEVLVRYRPNTGAVERQRAEFQTEADEVEPVGRRGARRLRSRRLDTKALIETLETNPDVELVEPNYLIRLALPNEPWFGSLWGLLNTGQAILGTTGIAGSDISVADAWDTTTGSRDNVVGIVDTGIDYNHPDLAANIWSAPRAFSVVIGGVVITCSAGTHGFNAITNTCNPYDDQGHGTHVAGTVGAVGNNGFGVAGVNWTASLMGLKFLSAAGSGFTSDAIKAIEFAIQAKAALGADANLRILSNSWGGGGGSEALRAQIEAANNADMLFVAASGNNARNTDSVPNYPSSYTTANMVSVAATTNRDQRASFSNWGYSSVHLGAPGQSILSTLPNNNYAYYNGTSMATPHVSGAAALVLAACARTTAQLRDALLTTVDPIAALAGLTETGGRLNAHAAVAKCFETPPALTIAAANGAITVALANGPGNARDWVGLYCPASNGNNSFTAWKYLDGTTTPPSSGRHEATLTFTAPAPGATCNARLFLNGGFTQLATSTTITIPWAPATVTVSPSSVPSGGAVTIAIANAPGTSTDWVGLYAAGGADSSPLQWAYLNGSQIVPSAGASTSTLQMTAPAAPGSYNARLFANNTLTKVGTSNTFTTTATPTLWINDVSVVEGTGSSGAAMFTVMLSPVNAAQTVTVQYQTTAGSALAGGDFIAVTGTLTFAHSASTATVSVPVVGDTLFEPNETFVVTLSSPTAAVIGDSQGVGTIVNDDLQPTAKLSVLTPSVVAGGTISFSVADGPANPMDWVGLYNVAAPDGTPVQWLYLNGSKTAPAIGVASASLQFSAPASPGIYDVRLFANNGFMKLATSTPITVAASQGATVSVPSTMVAPGAIINAVVSGGPANPKDWLALAPASAPDSSFLDWTYLNGQKTSPVSGVSGATLPFTAPATPGTYQIRFFANNSYTRLATSATITVAISPGAVVSVTSTTVAPGALITFVVSGGPANPKDWVALAQTSAPDSSFVNWAFLNGQQTAPATGLSGATLQFVAPIMPGAYSIRFFLNNDYTRLATSATITVSP